MSPPRADRRRLRLVVALVLGALFVPATAVATPSTAECVAAHQGAQRDRRDHRLRDAREKVLVCGQSSCPQLIREDCTQWLVDLDAQIPTVVVDPGASLPAEGARLTIDGVDVGSFAAGTAIPVDPGGHAFVVTSQGKAVLEGRAIVVEGGRAQRVALAPVVPRAKNPGDLGDDNPPDEPAPAPRERGSVVLPIAFGALSLAGFGVFGAFGIAGMNGRSDLDAQGCRPSCNPDDVSATSRDFLIADIGLAVGVVSLAAAVVTYVLGSGGKSAPAAHSSPRVARSP